MWRILHLSQERETILFLVLLSIYIEESTNRHIIMKEESMVIARHAVESV
jgi:hypothetical protein